MVNPDKVSIEMNYADWRGIFFLLKNYRSGLNEITDECPNFAASEEAKIELDVLLGKMTPQLPTVTEIRKELGNVPHRKILCT